MSLRRKVNALWNTRTAVKALTRIADGLAEQNALLARLADQFAPLTPPETAPRIDQDPTLYLNETELAAVLEYQAKVREQTGKDLDDEDLVVWLAERENRLNLLDDGRSRGR